MQLLRLPGLFDPHVHLRDPGATQKEDFLNGTKAALAGGIVAVLDMPNNPQPTITKEALDKKMQIAHTKTVCDYGFIFGASQEDNTAEYLKVKDNVAGLKVYMDTTTGTLLLEQLDILEKTFKAWGSDKPIVVHAEDATLAKAIGLVAVYGKRLHIAHLSQKSELEIVMQAKERRLPVTCEVTPHHLFLNEKDARALGPYGRMKPPLRQTADIEYIWKHIDTVDCIATDHAPHTKKEKESSNPPYGVPGLETSLPLMLTAMSQGKIGLDDIVRLMHKGPKRIFGLSLAEDTFIEVDHKKSYTIENKDLNTKCGWSPFVGMKVKGKVVRVVIRGKEVFNNGNVLISPGFGENLYG